MTMTDSKATTSPALHTISFDISTDPDQGVTVLIDDGQHLVARRTLNYLGFTPMELFSAELPLIPTYPPRRVALAQCSCGVAGCGNITALVAYNGPDESQVIWSDFRDLGSAVSGPAEIDPDVDAGSWPRLLQDDLVFDRIQYETAVLTASADRGWETPAETTARLLRGLLATETAVLRTLSLHLTWIAPSRGTPNAWTVALLIPHPHRTQAQEKADAALDLAEFAGSRPHSAGLHTMLRARQLRLRPWEHEPRQVLLQLTSTAATPILQAADLYEQLLDSTPSEWEHTFRWSGLPH
jgi:hypothetical protein